jgi:hypothetical protein
MGEAGAARVAEHFGVARLLNGTLQAYQTAQRIVSADPAWTLS